MTNDPKPPMDPDEPAVLRTQKAHQVTIEQGSKNAAGKRAETGERSIRQNLSRTSSGPEESLIPGRAQQAIAELDGAQTNAADLVLEAGRKDQNASQPDPLAVGGAAHRESLPESLADEHRELVTQTTEAGEHRERLELEPGEFENRQSVQTPANNFENRAKLQAQGEPASANLLLPEGRAQGDNFQAVAAADPSTGRVLAPDVVKPTLEAVDIPAGRSWDAPAQEADSAVDIEPELEEIDVLAELNALAEGVEEPTAEFYEQMDFPARVIHLHIENEKLQTQLQELEKPWTRV